MNQNNVADPLNKPCKVFHGVEGQMPTKDRVEFDNKTCDCGKFIYKAEMCGCTEPHLELKSYPNPDYIIAR